jgi:hypothetical protein
VVTAGGEGFRIKPHVVTGLARSLFVLVAKFDELEATRQGIGVEAFADARLAGHVEQFLRDWDWGRRQIHTRLLDAADLLGAAARNYLQLDATLSKAASPTPTKKTQ